MIPDGERLVGDYLRDYADIAALEARVAGTTPASLTKPWIRVTQLDVTDAPATPFEHLTEHMVQLDCYASNVKDGGQAEANLLARTARAALKALEATTVDDIRVTQVRFVGMARIPDSDFEPSRERVILTAEVRLHP